jgi:hypothetical protein
VRDEDEEKRKLQSKVERCGLVEELLFFRWNIVELSVEVIDRNVACCQCQISSDDLL